MLQNSEECLKYGWKSLRLHPSTLSDILGKGSSLVVCFHLQKTHLWTAPRELKKMIVHILNREKKFQYLFSCLRHYFFLASLFLIFGQFFRFHKILSLLRIFCIGFLINLRAFPLAKILIKWQRHQNLKTRKVKYGYWKATPHNWKKHPRLHFSTTVPHLQNQNKPK